MLLITMREWFGPSRQVINLGAERIKAEVRLRAFVTRLPLGQALMRIGAYESAFKARYAKTSAVEFELLQVGIIDDLSDEEIEVSRATLVERLDSSVEQMNDRIG
jgi:hypothetical protein